MSSKNPKAQKQHILEYYKPALLTGIIIWLFGMFANYVHLRISWLFFGDISLIACVVIAYHLNRERLGKADAILTGLTAGALGILGPLMADGWSYPYYYASEPPILLLLVVAICLSAAALKRRYSTKHPHLLTVCLSILTVALYAPISLGIVFSIAWGFSGQ